MYSKLGQVAPASASGPSTSVPTRGSQNLMRAALTELVAAKRALMGAAHEYQGHRSAAIQAVDQAIMQVHLALALGRPPGNYQV